jgi:hypothetical protein
MLFKKDSVTLDFKLSKKTRKALKKYMRDPVFREFLEEVLTAAAKWWPYLKTYIKDNNYVVTHKVGVFAVYGNRFITAFSDFVEQHDACFSEFLAGAEDTYVEAIADTFQVAEAVTEYYEYRSSARSVKGEEFTLEKATENGRAVFQSPEYYAKLLENA